MPVHGEEFEELLSGFIDGELEGGELRQFEERLRKDPSIQQRIDELRSQSLAVRELGKVLGATTTTRPLAQLVIAKARQQASDAGLPLNHHVRAAASTRKPKPLSVSLVASVLALAASLLFIVALPELAQSPSPITKTAHTAASDATQQMAQVDGGGDVRVNGNVESSPGPAGDSTVPPTGEYVRQGTPRITYVLVVDIEVTSKAWNANVLQDILASAGIDVAQPVVVDQAVTKAIDNSLMVVTTPAPQVERRFYHVVRADLKKIDVTLKNIWSDRVRFPRVTLNVAIDTRAELVRQVLGSMQAVPAMDSFAVPVAAAGEADAVRPSPFVAPVGGVKYVSNSARERGWNTSASLLEGSKDATVLIVAHIVD